MKPKIVFVLAVGRSGTKWLAETLDYDQNVIVKHEPVHRDFNMYLKKYFKIDSGEKYIKNFRIPYVKKQIERYKVTYIEVNGVLRLHASLIKKYLPEAILIHLVRNGKDVIRSMYSKNDSPILNTLYENSKFNSKFNMLCAIWAKENAYLRSVCDLRFHFENLIEQYDYFKYLLNFIDLNIEPAIWDKMRKKKINHTIEFQLNEYDEWPIGFRNDFNSICANEMEALGYE